MALNILIILLICLIFVILVAYTVRYLYSRKAQHINLIKEKQKKAQEDFDSLKENLTQLAAQKKNLQRRLSEMKEEELEAENEEEQPPPKTPLEILKEKNIISDPQVEKAENYLKNNEANLEVEDVMVMLGFVTPEELKEAHKESEG